MSNPGGEFDDLLSSLKLPVVNLPDANVSSLSTRNVVICSIQHAGSSSVMCSQLGWGTLHDGKVPKAAIYTSNRNVLLTKPLKYEGDKIMMTQYLDVGSLHTNKNDMLKTICYLPFVHCFMICLKLSRLSSKGHQELKETIDTIKEFDFPLTSVVVCVTHFDCKSDRVIQPLIDNLIRLFPELQHSQFFFGCFINPQLLDVNGVKVYSKTIQSTMDRFEIMLRNISSPFKIKGIITKAVPKDVSPFDRMKSPRPVSAEIKFEPPNVEWVKDDETRNVIMIGMTGAGKSAIINELTKGGSRRVEPSQPSFSHVTNKPVRARDLLFEMSREVKYKCSLADTVGFGDIVNGTDQLIDQLRTFISTDMPVLHLVVFTVKMDASPILNEKMMAEMKVLLKFIYDVMKVTKDQFTLLVTHSDFYAEEVRGNFLRQLNIPSDLLQKKNANIIFGCCPNTDEYDHPFDAIFKQLKQNTRLLLIHQISRAKINIPVMYNIRKHLDNFQHTPIEEV